jgi:rare lipoprotein A
MTALGLAVVVSSSGCMMTRHPSADIESPPGTEPTPVVPAPPEVVPQAEPKSRYGNPAYYDVFGKRYYVLSSSADYVERGVASWYGPGFHQVRTSSGEIYDMYGMTAAHRTLPLPAYVRVTNLQNGRSVVVRVNDRGPFVGNRIIDLSYTAAAKLDMLQSGTAMVEVRSLDVVAPPAPVTTTAAVVTPSAPVDTPAAPALTPSAGVVLAATLADIVPAAAAATTAAASADATTVTPAAPAATPATAQPVTTSVTTSVAAGTPKPILFVQAGAFADPANAERLAAKLRGGGYGHIIVRDDIVAGRRMYRVRIGPVDDVPAFDRIYAALEHDGVHDARLTMD